jgi:hypothetical protein
MNEAQSYLDRAKALNDKVEVERQRLISGLNQAVTLFGVLVVVFLSFYFIGQPEAHRIAKDNQEVNAHVYRR